MHACTSLSAFLFPRTVFVAYSPRAIKGGGNRSKTTCSVLRQTDNDLPPRAGPEGVQVMPPLRAPRSVGPPFIYLLSKYIYIIDKFLFSFFCCVSFIFCQSSLRCCATVCLMTNTKINVGKTEGVVHLCLSRCLILSYRRAGPNNLHCLILV
jgi:hypothetical protein